MRNKAKDRICEVQNHLNASWRDWIDESRSVDDQREQVCIGALQLCSLVDLSEEGVVRLKSGDHNDPSRVHYEVRDRQAYDRRAGELNLPHRFVIRGADGTVERVAVPEGWDYESEWKLYPENHE